MTVPRWKVMAGVLGISLGGLAAFAGQCPKPDEGKTKRAEQLPVVAEAPKVSPAGAGSAPRPLAPPVVDLPTLPTPTTELPTLPVPAGTTPTKLPDAPPPATKPTVELPPLEAPMKKPDSLPVVPASGVVLPALPTPASGTSPANQPTVPDLSKPISTTPAAPPAPPAGMEPARPSAMPPIEFGPAPAPTKPPMASPPAPAAPSVGSPVVPPSVPTGGVGTIAPMGSPSLPPSAAPTAPAVETPPATTGSAVGTFPTVTTTQTKFRIILRVGEGEPMFEVRHGDDLVMKVVCEKVDIKSPEKGQGLSAVTASGKVRFVGFGAEGTCDSLAFLAGTGEVSMTGNVKVQVKDKIGRIESELTTDKMHYKLDTTSNSGPGTLKP